MQGCCLAQVKTLHHKDDWNKVVWIVWPMQWNCTLQVSKTANNLMINPQKKKKCSKCIWILNWKELQSAWRYFAMCTWGYKLYPKISHSLIITVKKNTFLKKNKCKNNINLESLNLETRSANLGDGRQPLFFGTEVLPDCIKLSKFCRELGGWQWPSSHSTHKVPKLLMFLMIIFWFPLTYHTEGKKYKKKKSK